MIKPLCLVVATLIGSGIGARAVHAESTDELVEKGIKIFERVAGEADANKPDCDKIGSALALHMDDDAAVMGKLKDLDAKKTKDQKAADRKALEAKYGERMKAAKAKGAPLKACKGNAKVSAYMTKVMK